MKVASILPQKYSFYNINDDYRLALAQLINKPDFELYTKSFAPARRNKDSYVILDNGCYEGAMVSVKELIDKAKQLEVDEVVLPDVFNDGPETAKIVEQTIDLFREELPGVKLMAVVHGNSFDEAMRCLQSHLITGVDAIGIPRIFSKHFGFDGRAQFLNHTGHLLDNTEVHLLGCPISPIEIKSITKDIEDGYITANVRGVDSSIPYLYTRDNMKIGEGPRPNKAIDFNDETELNLSLLEDNLEIWKSECCGLPYNPGKSYSGGDGNGTKVFILSL